MLWKVAFSALLALCAVACSGTSPDVPETPISGVSGEHPADRIAAARHLPHALPALAVTDSLTALLDGAGRDELIARFRKEYEQAAFELVRDIGFNLLSPEALADLGVDIDGQAGVAIHGDALSNPSYVLFFELDKPARFKNLAYMIGAGRVGKFRMSMRVEGDAVVLGRGETALIIFDDRAMIVLGNNATMTARHLAALQPEESLLRHRPFRIAMRSTTRKSGVRGYFDVRTLFYEQAGLDPRWAGSTVAEARADVERMHRATLAGARDRGADTATIVAIDTRYRAALRDLEDGEFSGRIRALFGGVGGGSFDLTVSPTGAQLDARIDLEGDSLLGKVLRARGGKVPLIRGLNEPPSMLLGLSVDWPSVVKVARALELPLEDVELLIGGDLEKDLLPLLSGEVDVVTPPEESSLLRAVGFSDLPSALLIGVADAPRVEQVLTQFATRGDGESALAVTGKRTWTITLPERKPFTVRLDDRHLVVSLDDKLFDRMRSGKMPSGPSPWALATKGGDALNGYAKIAAILALTMTSSMAANAIAVDRMAWHDPEVEQSPAYVDKLEEINAIDRNIAQVSADRRAGRHEKVVGAAGALGALGMRVSPSDHGLAIEASFRTGGRSAASVLATMMGIMDAPISPTPQDIEKVAELRKQRKLRLAELDAIHEKDAQAVELPPEAPKKVEP